MVMADMNKAVTAPKCVSVILQYSGLEFDILIDCSLALVSNDCISLCAGEPGSQ